MVGIFFFFLFLFLKFISCVIPTIEYDHTISVDGL